MTNPDVRIRHACDHSAEPASARRPAGFASALRLASVRAADLRRRADGEPHNSEAWLLEALHALDHAHAELLAAQDELYQRADELLSARVEHELEWQRYRDLFEAAPISYVETDMRGNVIEANRRCCELLNIAPRQIVDKPLVVYVAQADRPLFRQNLGLLAQRSERASLGLRLQPRHASELIAVLAQVAAVENTGRARAFRWAFCEPGDASGPAPTRPHPLAFVGRAGKHRVAARHRLRARK
jgi:PAS domain S-box-containing protein